MVVVFEFGSLLCLERVSVIGVEGLCEGFSKLMKFYDRQVCPVGVIVGMQRGSMTVSFVYYIYMACYAAYSIQMGLI